jgi:amino acid transporter
VSAGALVRRILLGRPLATSQASHERLPKRLALAVFSSDALSSTAYATEEILRVLMVYSVGAAAVGPALGLGWPIAIAIAALLVIVALSYRQTIFAYPGGASAYLVSKDNLGTAASLIAGASLLMDYILTVSVSISAGVAAIISAASFLQPYVVPLCLFFIALITYFNLRGTKESGAVFALPAYGFIFSMLLMIVISLFRILTGNIPAAPPGAFTVERATEEMLREHGADTLGAVTAFVVLRAFTSGCTALTGIEAISDGIPAFKKPEARNAATTLIVMVFILTTMFLGMSYVANAFHVPAIPEGAKGYETVISQIGRRVFTGPFAFYYYILMFFSASILVVAANTAYQDFPRLASLLAKDRFLPRQLADLGDRLVFNNGILALAGLSAALVVMFKGSVTSLLPLYAVGVFTSFTLSQSSMVRKWLRERGPGWQASMAMNLVGALATGVVLVVIAITKFNAGEPIRLLGSQLRLPFGEAEDGTPGIVIHYGAWLVIALVPLLVWVFRKIRDHYADVARFLVASEFPRLTDAGSRLRHTVLVLVPGLHRGIFPALEYARSLCPDARAVHIEIDPANTPTLKELWEQHVEDIPLVVLESPFRNLREPIVEYIQEVTGERDDDEVTIVIPELVANKRWWHPLLHNSSADAIRRALGERPGVVVTSFRYFADETAVAAPPATPAPPGDTRGVGAPPTPPAATLETAGSSALGRVRRDAR